MMGRQGTLKFIKTNLYDIATNLTFFANKF
jgi:hypothetical protein